METLEKPISAKSLFAREDVKAKFRELLGKRSEIAIERKSYWKQQTERLTA